MYELLGQTTNEESLGDVVEMILGFFEVMCYFQHELPLWRDAWKIKREFEHSIVRHLAGNVSHTTGQNRKRNKPSAQLGAPTKEVMDIMNALKPRHSLSLVNEQANQGSKRKATENEGDGLGPEPDQSRSSQPNEEKEEKKQRVIDGRRLPSSSWTQWRSAWEKWDFVQSARIWPTTATARIMKRLLETRRR